MELCPPPPPPLKGGGGGEAGGGGARPNICLQYTEKYMYNFFKYQGKIFGPSCFLKLKIFLCLNALPYCFFFTFLKQILTYNLRNKTKRNWYQIYLKILKQSYNTLKKFSILSSFFMSHVDPKWNIYLSLCLANFENRN